MASRLLRATQALGTFGKRNISLQRIVKATTAATAVFFLVQQSTRLNREIESAIANLRRFMDNVNRSLASDEQLEGALEAVDSILGFLFDLLKKGVQFSPAGAAFAPTVISKEEFEKRFGASGSSRRAEDSSTATLLRRLRRIGEVAKM